MRLSRVRLSVRLLMVLVLVLGGGFGWVVRRAEVQRDIVAAVRRADGSVTYSWQWRDGQYDSFSRPGWPGWLLNILGPDYFYPVVQVSLMSGKVDDPLMAQVARLSALERLRLHSSKGVTDAGLAHLRGLTALRDLDLSLTSVTRDGLKHLAGLTGLERLELPSGGISDGDLAQLKGLVHLETLSLPSPLITSAGLVALRDMKHLKSLDLQHTRVNDLEPIRHLTGLTSLNLGSTPIGDAGLAPVAGLTRLQSLYLNETRITDAGVAYLRGLECLTQLNLDATETTDAGLAHIAGLKNLENLWLDSTSVSDLGLSRLAGLNKVRLLCLARTRVTNAGLAHVEGLKECEQITVGWSAGVTAAGIATAQQNRPRTRFIWMGPLRRQDDASPTLHD